MMIHCDLRITTTICDEGGEMKETPRATEKCVDAIVKCFDDRTGVRVQELLDSLYAKGYTQDQICEALKANLQ